MLVFQPGGIPDCPTAREPGQVGRNQQREVVLVLAGLRHLAAAVYSKGGFVVGVVARSTGSKLTLVPAPAVHCARVVDGAGVIVPSRNRLRA